MFSSFRRAVVILHVILRYRLLALIPSQHRPLIIRALLVINAIYPKTRQQDLAINLKNALESLGPVWIKLGQMLSTRRDLFDIKFSLELAKLQDQVQPFDANIAIQTILRSLKINALDERFQSFETTPIATASIAQVHGAELHSDAGAKSVVVKVIRPGIGKQIHADLTLMATLAAMLERFVADSHRFKPREVVNEYRQTILAELDLKQEAANGLKLARNFADSTDLYIPHIYAELGSKDVLIMERIDGIPVSDIEALQAQGVDFKKLAERGVRVFFTQVFRDSFFHADMHPGNIFIAKHPAQDPHYIGLDFGIVGTLNSEDKRYLAENFVAFFNRDYRKVAELHVQSGWVPSHINIDQFELAIETVCDPIFNKPLAEISFAQVLIGLFDTARQFEMEVQPQLVLLQKTLLYVEGLGRQLYPQLDLWDTAKPFLEQWISEQVGFKAFIAKTRKNAPYWLEQAPEVPELLYRSMNQLLSLPTMQKELIDKYQLLQTHQRRFNALLGSAMSLLILLVVIPGLYGMSEMGYWLYGAGWLVELILVKQLSKYLSSHHKKP